MSKTGKRIIQGLKEAAAIAEGEGAGVLHHNGYAGRFEYDPEANLYHGEILGLRDVVTFQGRTIEELQTALMDSITDYLEFETEDANNQSSPPEEVLGEITPGRLLRGARHREGLTQQALADAIGGKKHHISEMEHNKRPIDKKLAKRLAEVLEVDYRMFL